MALHEIAKVGGTGGTGSFSFSPPAGKIWKVYGYWYQCTININGASLNQTPPDGGTTDDVPKAFYLDDADTLSVSGDENGSTASMYALEAGNSQTSTPIETSWFTGGLGGNSNTTITVPNGSWKIFTRSLYHLYYKISVDEGDISWVSLNLDKEKTPYVTGGRTIKIVNEDSSSINYALGMVRVR